VSPRFKFLDAYEQEDRDIFFGRSDEIEQLYRLTFQSNFVLVYGKSGTGKTSLIRCGLANRFQATDWFPVMVRRKQDLNEALAAEIRALAQTPIPPEASIADAVQSLYLDRLRPIYLIFDQFEELFILGTESERQAFFDTLAQLLGSAVSCKIIVSMREEYLAMLNRYERTVPTLFRHRLRVEPMSMANLQQVILGTASASGITLEHCEATAQKIIDALDDGRNGVQLAYLQVYLDRLYRGAVARGDGPIVFTDGNVEETGKLGDVMEEFLAEQIPVIQHALADACRGVRKNAVRHLLEAFVTEDGTKLPNRRSELLSNQPALAPCIDAALGMLQQARILRSTGGDTYELTHDSLAAPIAQQRSAERKILLQVQRLVRDRLGAFAQTRTLLNKEERAFVARYRPQLSLSVEEERFVDRSASQARSRLAGRIGIAAAAALVVLLGAMFLLVSWVLGQETSVRAQSDVDTITRVAIQDLRSVPGTEAIRRNLLNTGHERVLELYSDSFFLGDDNERFWNDIAKADMKWEKGSRNEARRMYRSAMQEVAREVVRFPDDPWALIRYRALLVRMIETEPDRTRRRALDRELLEKLPGDTDDSSNTDFEIDRRRACQRLRAEGETGSGCPPPRELSPPQLSAAE
jgi:hypothetical protein